MLPHALVIHTVVPVVDLLPNRKAHETSSPTPLKTYTPHHSPTDPSPSPGTWSPTIRGISPSAPPSVSFMFPRRGFRSESLNFLCAADKKVFRSAGKVGVVQVGGEISTC